MQFLRKAFDLGAIGILNELTLTLKYGDLSLVVINEVQPLPILVEVKKSGKLNQRGMRQIDSLKKLSDYLLKDVPIDLYHDGQVMQRIGSYSEEISYPHLIPGMFEEARKNMYSSKKVEDGLFYHVIDTKVSEEELALILSKFPAREPILQFSRNFIYAEQGYTPLSITVGKPENYWDLLMGNFEILTIADFSVIEKKLNEMDCKISYLEEDQFIF
ncbi:MAG: hypothetical protein IPN74_16300 [Haliscomenobacter sp.]|nr:hypothetical protein [Haliscomenobacter sp.]